MRWRDQNHADVDLYGAIMQMMERLLKALASVYEEYSSGASSHKFDVTQQDFSSDRSKIRIMDMELDMNDDSKDVDVLTIGGKIGGGVSSSIEKWKLGMILLISNFFSVSQVTWDVLYDLLSKETDQMVCYTVPFSTYVWYLNSMHAIITSLLIFTFFISTQVRENILLILCQHPYWSSLENLTDMVIYNSS